LLILLNTLRHSGMKTVIGIWRNIDKPKGSMIGNDSRVWLRNLRETATIPLNSGIVQVSASDLFMI